MDDVSKTLQLTLKLSRWINKTLSQRTNRNVFLIWGWTVPLKETSVFGDLYKVLIHSQCITYSRWQLAHNQFIEAAGVPVQEVKQCIGVDRGSSKMYLSHLKKSKYQFKCTLYLEYFHCFTLSSDSLSRLEATFIHPNITLSPKQTKLH